MSEYKFKIGDRVRNLEDDTCLSLFVGDIGTIDQNDNSVPWVKWDKGIREAQYEEQLELIVEEKENIMKEYKWYEAVEMMYDNNKLEFESASYSGKLVNDGIGTWLNSEDAFNQVYVNKLLVQSTWTIVKPKLDLSTLKVDTLLVVWDNDTTNKYNRYFAKYENGKVFTFNYGATSLTRGTTPLVPWDNAELYTEEN